MHTREIYKYQAWQLLTAIILIGVVYSLTSRYPDLLEGDLWGFETSVWLVLAVLSPVIHQLYVWAIWRFELYQQTFSRKYGTDLAFKMYKKGFTPLILARLLTLILLAIANRGTLDVQYAFWIGLLFLIPAAYLGFSVVNYFGFDRAYGIDHFKPEEAKNYEIVHRGIFKYTSNGMYVFGFFILYVPGFMLASKAALIIALFNHIFIWAHYYCTELPDMRKIYG
jgi:phospholipid methyltransferase